MKINNTQLLMEQLFGVFTGESTKKAGRTIPCFRSIYSSRGFLASTKSAPAEWKVFSRVEMAPMVGADLILGEGWFNQLRVAEVNFGNWFTEESLRCSKGAGKFDFGLNLETLAVAMNAELVITSDESYHMLIGNITIANSFNGKDWSLDPMGVNQDPRISGWLATRALEVLNASLSTDKTWTHGPVEFIPVRNSWIRTKNQLRWNLVVAHGVTVHERMIPFMDIVFSRLGIFGDLKRKERFIRLGADVISAQIINGVTSEYTIAVYPDKHLVDNKDQLEDDGNIYIKDGSALGINIGESALCIGKVLEMTDDCGRRITPWFKGRVIVNSNIAEVNPDANPECIKDFGALHTDEIDGWGRAGNFKYHDLKPGIYKVVIGVKKQEAGESEKVGGSISQTALTVGKLTDTAKERLSRELLKSTESIKESTLDAVCDKGVAKILSGNEKALVNSDMARFVLGMTDAMSWNHESNSSWLRPMMKKAFRIQSHDVKRVPIVVTSHIAYSVHEIDNNGVLVKHAVYRKIDSNEFVASEQFLKRLLASNKNLVRTVMRHPVFTATSYLRIVINLIPVPGFAERSFAILPAECGPDLGADGDDHGQFIDDYESTVTPGSIPAIQKHCHELNDDEFRSLSSGAVYMWASWAQSSIGQYVNCLHEAILYGADPNSGKGRELAQCCQALVQAPKKRVMPSLSYQQCRKIVKHFRNAFIGTAQEKETVKARWSIMKGSEDALTKKEAIKTYYDVDLENSLQVSVSPVNTKVSSVARKALVDIFNEYFRTGSNLHVATLNRKVVEALVSSHNVDLSKEDLSVEEIIPLAQDYYAFFFNLRNMYVSKEKSDSIIQWKLDSAVKLAAGGAMWLGRTASMNIADVLIEAFNQTHSDVEDDSDEEDDMVDAD